MFDRLSRTTPQPPSHVLCSDQNIAALDLMDVVDAEHVITVRIGSLGALATDTVRAVRACARFGVDAVLDPRAVRPRQRRPGGPERRADQGRLPSVHAGGSLPGRRDQQAGALQPAPAHRAAVRHASRTRSDRRTCPPRSASSRRRRRGCRRSGCGRASLESARDALYRRHPSIAGRPLVFVCPGAGLIPIRAWPIASFASVTRALVDRGYAVAIVGMAADRELAQTIQQACPGEAVRRSDRLHRRPCVRSPCCCTSACLLITNDGGTGHMAALTPIASIVLFGPETPVLYGSLSPRAINLHKPLSCSPCLTAYNHRQSPCDA